MSEEQQPNEQPEPDQQKTTVTPTPQPTPRKRETYVTEDGDNPLICRGID
ncbi:MAG: hypothetical protein WKG01_25485 [Kofleriaceae bacterium]